MTLRFKYSGVLATPEGGPLLTKRLAYVGDKNGYLMYAARWFPFHDYAADRATSDISISLPTRLQAGRLQRRAGQHERRKISFRAVKTGAYRQFRLRQIHAENPAFRRLRIAVLHRSRETTRSFPSTAKLWDARWIFTPNNTASRTAANG